MITFENVIHDRIINSLEVLLKAEFPSFRINYDEHSAGQSFLILPQSDNIESLHSTGQNRTYSILIGYRLKDGGKYTKNGIFKALTAVSERVKRLVDNNVGYSPSSSYKWHNAQIESIEYIQDEEDSQYYYANLIFSCESMEVR